MATFYIELKHDVDVRFGNTLKRKHYKAGFWCCEKQAPRMDDLKSNGGSLISSMPSQLAYSAERVWLEEDDRITYVKNRFDHNNVDMEEFTWVKLSAKSIKQ